jgi:hypothetical protein
MADLAYLASPYSHPDPSVRIERFEAVARAAAKLMAEGYLVFSPIAHSHPIAHLGGLDGDWDRWEEFDRAMLSRCQSVIVLQLDGWSESRGIRREIMIAEELGLEVTFLDIQPIAEEAAP